MVGAQENRMIFAHTGGINGHIVHLLPEDNAGFSLVFRVVVGQGPVIVIGLPIDAIEDLHGEVVEVDGRPAPEVIRTPRPRGNAEGKSRSGSLIGMEVAHSLDVDQVLLRFLADFLCGPERALCQDIPNSFPPANAVD